VIQKKSLGSHDSRLHFRFQHTISNRWKIFHLSAMKSRQTDFFFCKNRYFGANSSRKSTNFFFGNHEISTYINFVHRKFLIFFYRRIQKKKTFFETFVTFYIKLCSAQNPKMYSYYRFHQKSILPRISSYPRLLTSYVRSPRKILTYCLKGSTLFLNIYWSNFVMDLNNYPSR
jgi:hypothetical protein